MKFFSKKVIGNMTKVGSIYLLSSGTMLKVIDLSLQDLEPPTWIMRSLAIALFAGLPVVLYLAWRWFGDEWGQHDSAVPDSPLGKSQDPPPERSIAVLPFVNMSSDEEQEFFSDGLAEELLNLLAKIPELQVASRTSAFSFKGQAVDIPTVAQRLNVGHVLEGSVRKAGNRVRITAQLIRATQDVHEWSETFDRELDDIFAIQDEIAVAVVDALKLTLIGAAPPQVLKTDPHSYALYLKGVHFLRQLDSDGLVQAEAVVNEALASDPGYAPAWNLLGMVHCRHTDMGDLSTSEGATRARAAFDKALAIDADSAEAHTWLGWVAMAYDRDFSTAARHYQRALTLQPGNGEALGMAVLLALNLGRLDTAVSLGKRALVRDPMNLRAHRYLAAAYYAAGREAEAEQCYRQALTLAPDYISGHYRLGRVLLVQGDAQAGMEAMRREKHPAFRLTGLALAHHALGQNAESDAALGSLQSDWSKEAASQIAEVYAYRSETEAAFEWLRTAFDQKDAGLSQLKLNRMFVSLRDDPRWQELLNQLGLADDQLSLIPFEIPLGTDRASR